MTATAKAKKSAATESKAPKPMSIANTANKAMKRTYIWAPTRDLINVTDFNRREDYGTEDEMYSLAVYVRDTILRTGKMPHSFIGKLVEDQQSIDMLDGFRRTRAYDDLLADPEKFDLSAEDIEAIEAATFTLFLKGKDTTVPEMLAVQITANSSKHFAPYEQAKVLQAMEDSGMKRDEIKQMTGLSLPVICDRLKLLVIGDDTADFVQEKGISATATSHAVSQARNVEPENKAAAVQDILSEAADEAERQGTAVSKPIVEEAAVKVLPQAIAPPTAVPMDREELIAACADFQDWHKIPGKDLRRIVEIIGKVPKASELPQPEAELVTA